MIQYFQDLAQLFRNKTLNVFGIERDFLTLVSDGDIEKAIQLMDDNEDDVDLCINEYYPEKHKVMKRPNKIRQNQPAYITEKLPRNRQRFINEVALFFLLNNPIKWRCNAETDEENDAFRIFKEFIAESRFNTTIRQAKRLAGAETESAKVYNIYRSSKGELDCKVVVISRSKGYKLRTLIDQYGTMKAFALGYKTKENGKNVQHWDIQTDDFLFNCSRSTIGWQVETFPNPTGKINIIYFHQKKEWDGVQPLCEREEDVLSRLADNNNYFSDPIAAATADVLMNMADPDASGKMIQLSGDDSRFEYITPPQLASGWETEKEDLKSAILNDSFTPDFSYEGIKGYGTLSGSALRNAMVIGYVKRSNNLEIYEEGVAREVSVIKGYLALKYPQYDWNKLHITFEFSEPFSDERQKWWEAVAEAKNNGLISDQSSVELAGVVDDIDEELKRLKRQREEQAEAEAKMSAQKPIGFDPNKE